MQQGKVDEAIAELEELSKRKIPRPRDWRSNWVRPTTRRATFPMRFEYLKKANAEDPANEEAMQLLGHVVLRGRASGGRDSAAGKSAGMVSRANVDGYYILGTCYIQTKNYDQARQAFAKMFDVPGDSAAAYLFTARMLLRQEFDPVAEEYAQKAVALDPKLPLAHFLAR